MEMARDVAEKMRDEGKGVILDQFANPDNPLSHYEGTGPEIWRDTQGASRISCRSMGTTGTIMGCSRFFKEKNPAIQIVGCQPTEGSQIPGIRKWPAAVPAEDLRLEARRPRDRGVAGRRRGDDAARSRARRASSPASPPAARCGRRCRSRARSRTP